MSDDPVVEPVFDIDPSVITDPIYKALAARFEPLEHGTLAKAGGQTYVPWNLIANRLNVVLSVEKWSFRILREGFTASECWVLGELTATIRDTVTVRQQYGVSPLTVGSSSVDDLLKKAGTDALKKCAQVLGVALYLTDADERAEVKAEMAAARRGGPRPNPTPRSNGSAAPAAPAAASTPAASGAASSSSSTTATPAQIGRPVGPTPVHDAERAAVLTGATPPKPAGYFCMVCHGLVKSDGAVSVPRLKKDGTLARQPDGTLAKVSVPVPDFAPICEKRLGGFHCPDCYEQKMSGAA